MGLASTFIEEMIVLYLVAVIGFIVRKNGILNKHASTVLTQLVLYVTLPALIIFSLDTPFSVTIVAQFLSLSAISIYVLLFSLLLAARMRRHSSLPIEQHAVYEGIIIFGNQGFIGYAVSFILLGEQGIIYVTMFNIFYLILIWTYGIYLFSKDQATIKWRNIFCNPGIISTCIGLFIFLLPISLPPTIANVLELVGKMTIPLSMMMIGLLIGNVQWHNFSAIKNKYIWQAAVVKLLVIPLLIIPFFLLPISAEILMIAIIVSGMPSAPTISLYAEKYGGDSFFASLGTLVTTILCLMTIPFLYLIIQFLSQASILLRF